MLRVGIKKKYSSSRSQSNRICNGVGSVKSICFGVDLEVTTVSTQNFLLIDIVKSVYKNVEFLSGKRYHLNRLEYLSL